ncbi:MAG: DUF4337 domain-containing protein [Bacteroidetes bacterium]|nr:MAG: DUF4337 domain-containing protein [Bacteroidota bacterium]
MQVETTAPEEKKPFAKSESFEKWVALTTSIIAVALSLSTIFSNQSGDDLLVNRDKASNEWSRFQSKSIKQNLFEVHLEGLKLNLEDDNHSEKYVQKIKSGIAFFEGEIKRYEKEKKEIQKMATKHEKVSENADAKGNVLDLAEGLYQIAIVLAAVAMIARQGILWVLSIILGVIGICITSYAIMMP